MVDGTSRVELDFNEVLVLDSSTFIAEIGLTRRGASALKHYLFYRGTKLVVPQVVVEECQRGLFERAMGKRQSIEACLNWLARFCTRVNGWDGPSDEVIEEKAKLLAEARNLHAMILPDNDKLRKRAQSRNDAELPPGHRRSSGTDCIIWEHCLDLLTKHDVIFVSADRDFRGNASPNDLHPKLQAEVNAVGAGRRLDFHPSMESLLSDLRSEIPPISREDLVAFVYDAIAAEKQELETNSGCRTRCTGTAKQTRFTTDQADLIEVRLELEDQWVSPDGSKTYDFFLRGSCHYNLEDRQLTGLTVSNLRLSRTEEDGTVRAVKGSYVSIAAHAYMGAAPIEPAPEELA